MRLPILLISGSTLVGFGWKMGTRCGDILMDAYVALLEEYARSAKQKKTKLESVK